MLYDSTEFGMKLECNMNIYAFRFGLRITDVEKQAFCCIQHFSGYT